MNEVNLCNLLLKGRNAIHPNEQYYYELGEMAEALLDKLEDTRNGK